MKKIFSLLVLLTFILLPWHALLVTIGQCKFGLDMSVFRFWKEGMVLIFLATGGAIGIYNKTILRDLSKDKLIFGSIFLYIILCGCYIFFPHFHPEAPSFLGFRYDIFFFLAFLAAYLLTFPHLQKNILLKGIIGTTIVIMLVFLLWYLFFDIGTTVNMFGLSGQVSTFDPHGCLAFSQNVSGHHRLQATFGGPIRYSVYLVIIYCIFLGILGDAKWHQKTKYSVFFITTILFLASIFFSYTKTSYLGFLLGIVLFSVLALRNRLSHEKSISSVSSKYFIYGLLVIVFIGAIGMYVYRDLFLHLGSIFKRFENLLFSVELLRENIFGFGLGIAGPASVVAHNSHYFEVFLPENWYIQVWLETGIFGLFIFLSILWLIGKRIYLQSIKQKNYYSLGLFCAFVCICFMALFTHSFEEAATSYLLFFLLGLEFKNILK